MDDLIGEFITETSESLAVLDSELIKLEQNPNDKEILGNIFRLVHTIKGTCGFLGLPRLELVAHSGENVLREIRDGVIPVPESAILLVLESLDCIRDIVEHLTEHGEEPEGDDKQLISRLDVFAVSGEASTDIEKYASDHVREEASAASSVTEMEWDDTECKPDDAATLTSEPVIEGDDDNQTSEVLDTTDSTSTDTEAHTEAFELADFSVENVKTETRALVLVEDDSDAPETKVEEIRVSLDSLEHLMQMIGDLVLTRNQLAQISRDMGAEELSTPLQQLNDITTELRKGVMQPCMQSIDDAWQKFPLTLAIMPALIIESAGERFAIPQANVRELVQVGKGASHRIEYVDDAPTLHLHEVVLPLTTLAKLLDISPQPNTSRENGFVVVCEMDGYVFGVIVDAVFDTEEIVAKPLNSLVADIDVYSGSTILGDGSVIMLLDPNGLARSTSKSGVIQIQPSADTDKIAKTRGNEYLAKYLLFMSNDITPKAVSLSLVSHLEDIQLDRIEYSIGKPVIQYREGLMRLCTLPGKKIPKSGQVKVIVFERDAYPVGLIVDEICDIVEAPMNIQSGTNVAAYLGSRVIAGKATDIVNAEYLLSYEFQQEVA